MKLNAYPNPNRTARGPRRLWSACLLLTLSLLTEQSFAQSVVIGNTSGSNSYYYGPIYRSSTASGFNYSRYAYVYTASELGIPAGALITKVEWLKANSSTLTGNNTFNIWLENSTATTLTSGTNWATLSATATPVYSSTTQSFTGAADTWESYSLSSFTYTGNSLVLLTDHVKTGTASGALNYYYSAATGKAIGYANSTALSGTTTLNTATYGNNRPTIRITFSSGVPCSGTPTVAVAAASVSTVCTGVPFTLTATSVSIDEGITYQWQSAPAGSGTFTNITGATAPSYTVPSQSAATDYQLVVTCTNPGGGTSVSNVVAVAQSAATSCYCTPASTCTNEGITNVVLNTLHNSSAFCSSPGGYENYSAIGDSATTTLNKGGNYTITISPRVNSNPGTGGFWIDYNQNGAFEPSEFNGFANITTFSGTAFIGTMTKTFTVPATALTGTTRLRVRYNNSAGLTDAQACATGLYGETEDYQITIAPEVTCSGTPATPVASATVSTVCAATPFSLNATGLASGISGITYQWQSRAAGSTDPFTNITGATTVPYTVASQTTATEYRLQVNCAGGGTASSNGVTVNQNPVTACYCTPTSGSGTSYYITNFTTTGGTTNISNASGSAAGGYTDFHTTAIASALPGTNIGFSMTANGTSTFGRAIWVDYNENGIFESTERVANTTGYVGSPWTGSFTIPVTTTPGNKRMRIVAAYTNTNPSDPCTMTSSGEYEDYTLTVVALTPCTGTPVPGDALTFSTVHVTGYNADIVANGIGPVSGSTTADADGAGFYFLTGDFQATPTSPMPTYYLPLNGLINVAAMPGLKFQLANYTDSNSLRLNTSTPGTLTLTTPKKGTALYLLGTSGSGTSTISATVNFTDGSSQAFTGLTISDWYGGTTNVALQGIGRVGTGGGLEGNANDPRLYYFPLNLDPANYGKDVASITVARTAGSGIAQIMGVSMKTKTPEPHSQCAPFSTVLQQQNLVITTSGITMQWQESSSATGPFTDVTAGAGATTPIYTTGTISSNTYYRLKVTCTNSGLSAYGDTIAVIANSGIPITAPPANTGVCLGQPLTLSVTATGASSYQWFHGGTAIPGATGSTYTIPAATTADAGTYTVELNSCTMSPAATVTISTPFTVDLGLDTTLCLGDAVTLNAGNPGATYSWSTGATTQTVPVTTAGTYSVTVVNGACTVMDTIVIGATPYPVVDLGADTVICGGGPVLLNAGNPGASYAWSTGDDGQTLLVSTAGTYSVTVNNGSCAAMDTITIGAAPAPATGSIVVSGTMPEYTFSTSGSDGAVSYTWLLGDGTIETGETVTHTYIANGVYTVHLTVFNACGEMDTTSTLVTVSGLAVDYIPGMNGNLLVYPNPASGQTMVEVTSASIRSVEVLDYLGRVVLRHQAGGNKTLLDVKGLTQGVYTLRVQTDKGLYAAKLLVR